MAGLIKTCCPHCGKINEVPDAYKDAGIKCLACRKEYAARPMEPPPKTTPTPGSRRADLPETTGAGFAAIAVIVGIFSVMGAIATQEPAVLAGGLSFSVFLFAAAIIINRLDKAVFYLRKIFEKK